MPISVRSARYRSQAALLRRRCTESALLDPCGRSAGSAMREALQAPSAE